MSWPCAIRAKCGGCISNTCMKLWFEGWNVNARDASQDQPRPRRPPSPLRQAPYNRLPVQRLRGDSCRQQFSVQKCEERPMDFNMSDRQREWLNRVESFMHKHVRPAVPIYKQQDEAGERWKVIPILEDLKKKARAEGLWNMFMPPSAHEDDEFRGAGLSNLEY